MEWESVSISREELHEKVWAQSMAKLAKEYGLSDVGLTKICKRLKVPRPPQGYWARKRRGKVPALPPTDGPTNHVLQRSAKPVLELDPSQKAERERLVEYENQPENRIHIAEVLGTPHRLVSRTKERLSKAASKKDTTDESWLSPGAKSLDVCISPPLIDRAMLIMDALIDALRDRKLKITIEAGNTYVSVVGEKFRLTLEETSSRIDHKPTPQDIKQQKEFPWMKPPRYDYLPSGKLSLKIDKDSYGPRRTWNDGKKRRIEDCLNAFVIGLIEAAYAEKSKRAEAERQERERQEWERLRVEKVKLIQEEQAKLERLEANTDKWHRSKQIRVYIDAVQKEAINKDGAIDPEGDMAKWITWATQQADRFDPTKESPPSVLDEADKYLRSYW